MSPELGALLWKEMRQIPRKRSATISAVVFPLLFLVVLPLANILGVRTGVVNVPAGASMPTGFGNLAGDPAQVMRDFTLPLYITLAGLVIPSMAATYTIVGERERRTLELLVALPISLGQIVLAKLLAVLLLGAVLAVPLFLIDAALLIGLGLASLADMLALFFLLVAALLYSTSSALLIGLLAADFRTANNLNGAFLGPTILLSMGLLMVLPGGPLHSLLLGAAFLVLAIIITAVALRTLTIERFLR